MIRFHKIYTIPIIVVGAFCTSSLACAQTELRVHPQNVLQGEPILITVEDLSKTLSVLEVTVASTSLPVFTYNRRQSALYGFDLNKPAGMYVVSATLSDGTTVESNVTVLPRLKATAPLGVPDKLGGNTPESQTKIVSSLTSENKILASLFTGKKVFWKIPFQSPLASTTITDPYGYNRQTGDYTITHKGTDFRSVIGTPVYAMNRGVVRLTRNFRVYGKTVVIDHGLGLQTLYMHLSNIMVNEGELVLPGQIIGRSGDTGYAERPHLHVSVRIRGISIDPVSFLRLFD